MGKPKSSKQKLCILLVFVLLVGLIIFSANVYHIYASDSNRADSQPSPTPELDILTTPEPTPEPTPIPTPEPTPEPILIEANQTDIPITINGEPVTLLKYEIEDIVYVNLFELASALVGTDGQFFPRWDESNETIHIESNSSSTTGESDLTQIITTETLTLPIEIYILLDESPVQISAFTIEGDVYFSLNETLEVLDLIIVRDESEDSIDIYTSQTIANIITRRKSLDPSLPMVALTFDDGPHTLTEQVLDILEEHNAVATFYVLGNRVEKNSDLILRTFNMGNEIGNHSWSHPWLDRTSSDRIRRQLRDTNDAIEAVTGVAPTSMRPPYGSSNSNVRNVSRELGLAVVFWSIDPSDYLNKSPDRIFNDIMNSVTDRDIILLHDIHERTINATRRLVPALIEKGYQLVTVSELMELSEITLEPGRNFYHARG